MKRLFTICILLCVGCSSTYLRPNSPGDDYRWSIEIWQQKIQQEGWNEAMVDQVVTECLALTSYEAEPPKKDHWKTYREFLLDFQGDCEDIATFVYGTLKRLDYPESIRMRILRMPTGDHVVVMVKLPRGRWKMYNSVPQFGDFIDLALARTVVEWDEHQIFYTR